MITINTTSNSNPAELVENGRAKIEKWYVGNGQFGMEASVHPDYENPIEVQVYVSTMFPGTHEEWNNHIHNTIIEAMIKTQKTYVNRWGEISICNS